MPKISIILPCYNAGEYLHRSIPSCLNQTLTDIEILCVNDGSTDNTAEILQEYADKDNRIKIITQKNQGTLVARKRGMEQATGEYCMFLDQDDFYELYACQELYQLIEKHKVDMVDFGVNMIQNNSTTSFHILPLFFYKKCNSLDTLEKIVDAKLTFRLVLWIRIFSHRLYKKVASYIPEIYMTRNEDTLIVLLCFYFAKTYYSTKKVYYNYYTDTGFCKEYSCSQFQKAMSTIQTFHSYFMEFVEKQKTPLIFKKSLTKVIYQLEKDCITIWDILCPPERKEEGFCLILNTISKEAIVDKGIENYRKIQNQEAIIQNQKAQLQFFTSLFKNLTKTLRFPFSFLSRAYSFILQKIYPFSSSTNKKS